VPDQGKRKRKLELKLEVLQKDEMNQAAGKYLLM